MKAYISLITVIIVSFVAVGITVTFIMLGIGATQTSESLELSIKAKALADACAQDGLETIRENTSYTGTTNLSLGEGNCSFTVTNQGGEVRRIEVTGTVDTVIRKVLITTSQLNPQILISSWQEVADF
ncbi:MAG: hypothetical protein ACE5DX_00295 [Candidatus Dojkabacteria bacterium]